jgi:transcriptional regulator with PAS, ATPase and Fis domain
MFEVVDGGTLFLDEVGELLLGFQAKLLRAVQEREIRRVGGTKLIPVDVRLVSATNRDLAEAVRRQEFRDDLFYRLNVIQIILPPLRQRTGDVSLLAYHFLARCRRNRAQPLEGIETAALAALGTYSWPGNVRELQNVIERACALAEGPTVRLRDLPDHVRGRAPRGTVVSGKDLPLREAREMWLRTLTQEYLRTLLDRHGGNISQAAKTAGVNRKTLHRLLLKYNLAAPEGEESPAD